MHFLRLFSRLCLRCRWFGEYFRGDRPTLNSLMRIIDIHERAVPISRYQDRSLPSAGLTTSIVAVVTDVVRHGRPIIGYGFSSVGRFAQSGLIRDCFAPRLLAAEDLAEMLLKKLGLSKSAAPKVLCSNCVLSPAHRRVYRSGQDSRLSSCDAGTLQTRVDFSTR